MTKQSLPLEESMRVVMRPDGSVFVRMHDGSEVEYGPGTPQAEEFRACAGGDFVLGVPKAGPPPDGHADLVVEDVDHATRTVTFGKRG